MKMNLVIAAALTSLLALGAAAPAMAAGDRDHDRGRHGWDDRGRGQGHHNRGHDRGKARGNQRHAQRDWRDDRRHYGNGYKAGYRDGRDRGYYAAPRVVYRQAPPYGWARGHRYRDYYEGPVYVVHDYPRYNLRRPPHGHHWIRDDRGDMLLVAIATGIIADIILHH